MDMINLKNNMLMNKKKSLYEAPTTNILVIRIEESLLTVSNQNNTIKNATIDEWGDEL